MDSGKPTRGRSGTFVLVAWAALGSPAAAQDRTEITGEATYCDCQLVLEHVITLGDEGDAVIRNIPRQMAVSSDGVYHVLAWQDYQITRYAADGRPLEPVFTEGSGPLETKRVVDFAIITGDTLIAHDSGNARIIVVGPTGREVRTIPVFGGSTDFAYLPGGGLVANHRGFTPKTRGVPFHRYDESGSISRSFGPSIATGRDRERTWARRMATTEQSFWAVRQHWYELQRWSLDGGLEQTIERRMTGFEPRLESEWGGPDEPYKPTVAGIVVDTRGYVRTALRRAGPRWAELLPPPQSANGIYPVPSGIGLFETVIEIIDPVQSRLYARGIVQPEIHGFVDADHVFSYQEDDFGRPTVSIWRIRLSSPIRTEVMHPTSFD